MCYPTVMETEVRYRGHVATEEEIAYLRELIDKRPTASRRWVSQEACRKWNWVQPNGGLRDMVCRGYLLALHRAGRIVLPPPKQRPFNPLAGQRNARKNPAPVEVDEAPMVCGLAEIRPLIFRQVRRTPEEALFNSLMERHHYLEYTQPVGEHLKYLVYAAGVPALPAPASGGSQRILFPEPPDRPVGDGPPSCRPVACLAWSSAPRHLGSRDRFIGWTPEARRRNIRFVAYNTRFLILPWVRVPHLASHLLAAMARILSGDWERIYGHPIWFLETFIEPGRFRGTCYRAANWVSLGFTTGRGKADLTHRANRPVKEVLGYPLVRDFRERLGA